MNEENERNKNTLIVKNIKNEKRKSFFLCKFELYFNYYYEQNS